LNWPFSLKDGTIIHIYRRLHPTSLKTALQTFKAMQDHIHHKPLPGQIDWINLSANPSYKIEKRRMGYRLISLPTLNDSSSPTSFLYISPLTEKVRISGNLKYSDHSCSSTLRFHAIAQNGELLSTTQSTYSPQDPNHFSLKLQTNHLSHLVFQISEDWRDKDQRNSCLLSIDPLVVENN
jgi:hypothetical protein